MDVVHRGQPGEEQYSDISSVGEWESGQAHKYGHIKCAAHSSRAHRALLLPLEIHIRYCGKHHTVVSSRFRTGTCCTSTVI